MASFFDLLETRMGSAAYKHYMSRVFAYLGPYAYFAQWTCKRLARFPTLHRYRLCGAMCSKGEIELLDYLEKCGCLSYDTGSYFILANVETLKWLNKRGLSETEAVFGEACSEANYPLVDYCIKKRYSSAFAYRHAMDLKLLKYLWKKQVPLVESVWTHGFYLSMSEEKFLWLLQYRHHQPHFCFQTFMASQPMEERLKVLLWYNKRKMLHPRLVRVICSSILPEPDDDVAEVLLPEQVCNQLSVEYQRCFQSQECECFDESRHVGW